MSNFVFEETDSSVGEAVFAPYNPPMYPNPFAKIVVEQDLATRVVPECLRARGDSTDEEEVVDVVGGMPTGVRNRSETEILTS